MRLSIGVVIAIAILLTALVSSLIAFLPTYLVGVEGVQDTVHILRQNVIARVDNGVRLFFRGPAATINNFVTIHEAGLNFTTVPQDFLLRTLCGVLQDFRTEAQAVSLYTASSYTTCNQQYGVLLVGSIAGAGKLAAYPWNMTTMNYTQPQRVFQEFNFDSGVVWTEWAGTPYTERWSGVQAGLGTLMYAAAAPLVDAHGNIIARMTVDIQLAYIETLMTQLGLLDSGRAVIYDRRRMQTLTTSWGVKPFQLLPGWADLSLPQDQRMRKFTLEELSDPLINRIVMRLGGNAGVQRIDTNLTETMFSGGDTTYVDLKTFSDQYELLIGMLVAMPEKDFLGDIETSRKNTIGAVCGALMGMVLLGVALAVLVTRPLSRLSDRMHLTATLKDSGEDDPPSILSEIAAMQAAYSNMRNELYRMKSYLPQSIMNRHTADVSGNSTVDLDDVATEIQMDKADALLAHRQSGVDTSRLVTAVNTFRSCDCVVLQLTAAYSEEPAAPGFAAIASEFFEAVHGAADRERGVVETLRPGHVIVSFGARAKINNPAMCALRTVFALQEIGLRPEIEWSAIIDRGSYFVGTCGSDFLRQESICAVDLEILATLGPLLHTSLRLPVVATGRVTASFSEFCTAYPVDRVRWSDGSNITLYALAPGVLEHHDNAIAQSIMATKTAFSQLSRGRYKEGAKLLHEAQSTLSDDSKGGVLVPVFTKVTPGGELDGQPKMQMLDANMSALKRSVTRLEKLCNMLADTKQAYARKYIGWPVSDGDGLASAFVPVFDERRSAMVPSNRCLAENLQELDRVKELRMPKFLPSSSVVGGAESSALFEMAFTFDDPADDSSTGLHTSINQNHSVSELPGGTSTSTGTSSPLSMSRAPRISPAVRNLSVWRKSLTKLGSGTFGDVHRALHENGSIAAMKVVPLNRATTDIDELRKELLVTAGQRHENLVSFVDAQVTDEEVVVVMELMAGGSLESLQNDFGRLPTAVVRRFVIDVLRGLSHLHRSGIIHCDIKPQNVLVGVDGMCKLADFGSAMHPHMNETAPLDDTQPVLRGTPAFISPECARGADPSEASDIWAVGILVHELVVGSRPFNARQNELIRCGGVACVRMLGAMSSECDNADDARAPPTIRIPSSLPNADAVEAFVSGCLSLDPAQRPTAEELLSMDFVM